MYVYDNSQVTLLTLAIHTNTGLVYLPTDSLPFNSSQPYSTEGHNYQYSTVASHTVLKVTISSIGIDVMGSH